MPSREPQEADISGYDEQAEHQADPTASETDKIKRSSASPAIDSPIHFDENIESRDITIRGRIIGNSKTWSPYACA